MKIVFVSNYINHHQLPFCEAMLRELGEENFIFAALQPIEEERLKMGWGELRALPFVKNYYEEPEETRKLILNCDVLLFGGMEQEELVYERMKKNLPVLRISERIYKEGQWKAVSPRGLIHKYREFTRFRRRNCWLLCAGAYVASDFALIRSFPEKKLTWGYFPRVREQEPEKLFALKEQKKNAEGSEEIRILWSGRFVDFKHIEDMLDLIDRTAAEYLPEHPEKHLRFEIIGGGEGEELLKEKMMGWPPGLVTFSGFMTPEEVRNRMERAHIYVFTSGQGEGWGAVVNEAMNSGCTVLAGIRAGAVPSLICQGENGLIYENKDSEDLYRKLIFLIEQPELRRKLGENAIRTVEKLWNADTAAVRLTAFCSALLEGKEIILPEQGPMSRAKELKPFPRVESLEELEKIQRFSEVQPGTSSGLTPDVVSPSDEAQG